MHLGNAVGDALGKCMENKYTQLISYVEPSYGHLYPPLSLIHCQIPSVPLVSAIQLSAPRSCSRFHMQRMAARRTKPQTSLAGPPQASCLRAQRLNPIRYRTIQPPQSTSTSVPAGGNLHTPDGEQIRVIRGVAHSCGPLCSASAGSVQPPPWTPSKPSFGSLTPRRRSVAFPSV
jgi:hypothetical protein